MLDLWEAAARNRRNSVLLMVAVVLLATGLGWLFTEVIWPGAGVYGPIVTGGIALVLAFVAFSAGDSIVLAASRARRIEKKDAPQLWNVVEEVSIAAEMPMPRVYLIEDSAPNAFATGRKPENATVAITRGLLDKLSREELQGVMAHEVAHIGNRDILFATLMAVMVGSIALLSDMFLRSLWFGAGRRRSSSSRGGGAQAALLVVGILLAILAPIFARLLQLAVSRQREYLADATGARLTRNPLALASALRRISGDRDVLEAANRGTAHLYVVNPIKKFESRAKGLLSTHPPIEDRVARLQAMAGEFEEED